MVVGSAVHRDLKPDNVMIVRDPEAAEGERVKIFDFGLAKLRSTSLAQATGPTALRTQPGMIMGTPTHMAPEQCRGASNIDGKADVYALGVMLFEALVGHPPFFADNVGELMTMHLRDVPPGLRKLDPSIPKGLAELVHVMLAKETEDRPDMGQVCAQLVSLAAQRPRRTNKPEPDVLPSAVTDFLSERHKPKTGATTGGSKPLSTGQAQEGAAAGSRPFFWAIVAAAGLVAISGALLFDVRLPSVRSAAPEPEALAPRVSPPPAAAPPTRAAVVPTPPPVPVASVAAAVAVARPAQVVSPPSPEHSAASARPGPRLRWELASRPPGATVMRVADGKILGTTPWTYEQPEEAAMLRLTLLLDGYADAGVILDLSSASNQTVVMLSAEEARAAETPTPLR